MNLAGRRVLVTGATGFVGGRLVEKLILYHQATVRALVRRFDHACRLARFPVEIARGTVTDRPALDQAVAGCDFVIHCAHDWHNRENNLAAVDALAEACLRHRTRSLVFVSTISVNEPLRDGVIDESVVAESVGWTYCDTKRAMEISFLRWHRERGLPVSILEPTIMYGPFCQPWTVAPMEQMRLGKVVLPDQGGGFCNAVYVDDAVDALILAMTCENAAGERFLVSGAAPITWRTFYESFSEAVGRDAIAYYPAAELERMVCRPAAGAPAKTPVELWNPRKLLRWAPARRLYMYLRRRFGEQWVRRLKRTVPPQLFFPTEQVLRLYQAKATVRIEKARRVLDYEPAFDFARGMRVTAEYIRRTTL